MAFSLIANVGASSTDAADVTTGAIDTTGADFIVAAAIGNYDFAGAPTDSKGNTWTGLTEQVVFGGERVVLFYTVPASVGTGHTFALSTATKLPALCVAAFSGGHQTAPFDQENGADTFGSTLNTGSITPSQDDCLIVTGIAFNVAGTLSIGSGFSITNQQDKTANSRGGGLAWRTLSPAAAINPQLQHSPGGSSMATRIASFKPAGGGGGGGFQPAWARGSNVVLLGGRG